MSFVSKTSKYVYDPEREFLLKLKKFNGNATHEEFWDLFWEHRFFIKPEPTHFKTAFGEIKGGAYYNLTASVIGLFQDSLWKYNEYKSEAEIELGNLKSILYGLYEDDDNKMSDEELRENIKAWEEMAEYDPIRKELDARCRERYEKVVRHFNNGELSGRISPEMVDLREGYAISYDWETQIDDDGHLFNKKVKRDPFEFLIQFVIRDVFREQLTFPIILSDEDSEIVFPRKSYNEPPVDLNDLALFPDDNNSDSNINTSINLRQYIIESYVHNRPDIVEYLYDICQDSGDSFMSGTIMFNRDRMYCSEMFCAVTDKDYQKWKNGDMYFCSALKFGKNLSPLATKKTIIETFKDEIDYDTNTFGGWWTTKYNYGIYTYREFYDHMHRILSHASVVDNEQTMPNGDKIRIIGWMAPDNFEGYYKEEFGIEDNE